MRVITGRAKGRQLKAPKGMNTRPTSDRVKEALFNVLGGKVENARFLDLFAGSGNVGIEALSRGAIEVFFVENNLKALKVIKENLELTGFQRQSQIISNDVIKALDALGRQQAQFDLVFVDPPYLKGYEQGVLDKINHYRLLAEGGILVIESSKRDQLPDEVGEIEHYRSQHYGDTCLSYYQIKSSNEITEGED
ncbi:MAG: 16S rRNA (guanine(966)-N(2))-methyltransferase RsmD [Clostridia bacterium]|nr:16S rRNA (guanine(966)-N(2))-methyltransferase RsmD [Clostridia bacterium]